MARAYYSTVFMQSADDLWSVIRDFNNCPVWVDGSGSSEIEDGKSGDAVGAVRNVLYQGKRLRQVLLALSDVERSQTYAFCGEAPVPVTDYRATLRVSPVTDRGRAFVEWSASFDCLPERLGEWTSFFHDAFGRWLHLCGVMSTVAMSRCGPNKRRPLICCQMSAPRSGLLVPIFVVIWAPSRPAVPPLSSYK
ncbi:MAG: SRPBCC family protein [Xanthobacteraceae bacterium]